MASRLRLTAHPVELFAQEVVGTVDIGVLHGNALLTFLKIIGIVALVGIERAVGKFDNPVAHVVEEVSVVGHHQDRHARVVEIVFEPLHHLEVEVVGRLVEDEQLRLIDEHVSESQTLALTSAHLAHWLVHVGDLELGQDTFELG